MEIPAARHSTTTMTLDSRSIGNPDRFLRFDDLRARVEALAGAPTSSGRVALIVRRGELGRRETPARLRLTREDGVPGDLWSVRGRPDPEGQIAIMQVGVAELIANGQSLELFGDNLFLDLDLSAVNLPPGSRVQAGGALLQVTPKAHNGCHKFESRFGAEALRLVWDAPLRHRNLRGIYMRVLEPGEIAVGDAVEVISRAESAASR
jgi:hypothetical protein